MKRMIEKFIREDSGVSTVEYAIMLSLVALAVALATPNIREAVVNVFVTSAEVMNEVEEGASS
jgi:Flp pilus assembly pilin Flp